MYPLKQVHKCTAHLISIRFWGYDLSVHRLCHLFPSTTKHKNHPLTYSILPSTKTPLIFPSIAFSFHVSSVLFLSEMFYGCMIPTTLSPPHSLLTYSHLDLITQRIMILMFKLRRWIKVAQKCHVINVDENAAKKGKFYVQNFAKNTWEGIYMAVIGFVELWNAKPNLNLNRTWNINQARPQNSIRSFTARCFIKDMNILTRLNGSIK